MASCGKQYPVAQAAAYHYTQQPYAPVPGAPVTGIPLTNQMHNSTELPPPLFGTPADDSYNTQAPPQQQQYYQKPQKQQQPAYAPASNNAYPNIEPTQSQNVYSVPYYAQYPYLQQQPQQPQQQQQALYSASNNNNNSNNMYQSNVSAQAPYTYAAPPPAALNAPQDQGHGIDEAQQAPPQHQKSKTKSLFSYLNTAMDYRDKSLQQASQFWSEARHTGQRFVGRSSPPQRDDLEARRRYRERYGEEPK